MGNNMRVLTGQIFRISLFAIIYFNLSSITSPFCQIFAETVEANAEIMQETSVKAKDTTTKIDSISLAAGLYHSLYIKTDGTLWAIGYNNNGQLGDGATDSRSTSVYIAGDVKQAAAGNVHSLFLKQDGTMWAMGL
jgi:alpha-tubulin suppressor-like RCC1 family protein